MRKLTGLIVFCLASAFAGAQQPRGTAAELPVRRIALFSSGVGYFEHSGSVSGSAEISLPFDMAAVNDALKSLVVGDPAPGASPSVNYPSEETLEKTLESLRIDLSGSPGTAEIFAAQRGAEIEVAAPNPVTGRIVGVEYRAASGVENGAKEAWLSLLTSGGFRLIALKDIGSFSFKDPAINADLARALDLIGASRTSRTRNLMVKLPGSTARQVTLSYVIPMPVWKVSYRLDLGQRSPLFQGWAIIDNDGDTDWTAVELSLVSGRPVSFIQNLYPPYYLRRPTLPLAIAGTAEARSHASGYYRTNTNSVAEAAYDDESYYAEESTVMAKSAARGAMPLPAAPVQVAGVQAAAAGSAAGDQFAYTVQTPVTLPRRQSAMIPLVNSTVQAAKTLILSGTKAQNTPIHPELAAELTNTTGMKLPAGPITVYDGTYAGDALIDFFGENDRRFISYGEDLSVTGSFSFNTFRTVSGVTVSSGIMTISRRVGYERIYTVKNTAAEPKRLIIEHPITGGASLVEPKTPLERTAALYRFVQTLPANGELTFTVREEAPAGERIVLGQLKTDNFVSYSTNGEIPANVQAALTRAAELRQKTDSARKVLSDLETRRTRLLSDQERVRSNLAAVGAGSDLGREYMKRMTALDSDIDGINVQIDAANKAVQNAQKEADDYISGLKL